jgi:hypothetical protein
MSKSTLKGKKRGLGITNVKFNKVKYTSLLQHTDLVVINVVDPNPKESEYFGLIRIRKKSSDLDSDPDTVVE